MQRIDDPSSPYGTTVLVANVWWLELGGRFHGVLPGCYRLAWRLRLEVSQQLKPPLSGTSAGGAVEAAACKIRMSDPLRSVIPSCLRCWLCVCLLPRPLLQPGFYLDRLHLFARQEQPSAGPAAASASGCEAREGVQDWEWTLEEAAIAAARAQAAAGQAGLAWFALGSAAEVQQAHSVRALR